MCESLSETSHTTTAGNDLLLAAFVQSPLPAECRLMEEILAVSFLNELLARLIGDQNKLLLSSRMNATLLLGVLCIDALGLQS